MERGRPHPQRPGVPRPAVFILVRLVEHSDVIANPVSGDNFTDGPEKI